MINEGDHRFHFGIDYKNLDFSGRHSEHKTDLPCQVCYGAGVKAVKVKKQITEVTCEICRGTGKYIIPGFRPIKVRMGNGEATQGERRTPDGKLNDMLKKAGLMEAADQLREVYENRTRGLGAKTTNYESCGKSLRVDDYEAAKQFVYLEWRKECKRVHISSIMTMDVIIYGASCSEVDKARSMRNGETAKQLILCLNKWRDLYNQNVSRETKAEHRQIP